MISLHVFTEEPSAKNVFNKLLPKILPENVSFRIYDHQGKQDLEKALRTTIPSISKIPGARILITRDQDSGDCKEIKSQLNEIVKNTCSSPYLIRIVCRELESWFLGDLIAVQNAYPRLRQEQYVNKSEFRNVDGISNANLALLRIIPEYSDRGTLPKLETSENIAQYLSLEGNTSTSFNQTIDGIRQLIRE